MGRSFTPQGGAGTPFEGQELLSNFTVPPLSANTNDLSVNQGAFRNASVLVLSATAPVNLTGLTGATPNREVVLLNVGASTITLKNASGASAAGNRFALGADVALAQFAAVKLLANAAASGWVQEGAAGSGGGGAPTTATYTTVANETATLPNSRELAAGSGITLDVSVPGVMTIDAATAPGGATTELQYNHAGVLDGLTGFTVVSDPGRYTISGPNPLLALSDTGSPFETLQLGAAGTSSGGGPFINASSGGLQLATGNVEVLTLTGAVTTGASAVTFVGANAPAPLSPVGYVPVTVGGLTRYLILWG